MTPSSTRSSITSSSTESTESPLTADHLKRSGSTFRGQTARHQPMRGLFATAELAPFVKVGGLGDAGSGVVNASLVLTPTMARPHPYNDAEGRGWPGNDTRFFSFSAAVAALARADAPDVLHLNAWHTGDALA